MLILIIYKQINKLYCLSKNCENKNKDQSKPDQVEYLSTDNEIVQSSNKAITSQNS